MPQAENMQPFIHISSKTSVFSINMGENDFKTSLKYGFSIGVGYLAIFYHRREKDEELLKFLVLF